MTLGEIATKDDIEQLKWGVIRALSLTMLLVANVIIWTFYWMLP